MAPTEILATQHFETISTMVEGLGIRVAFIRTVKGRKRQDTLNLLAEGFRYFDCTYALIEDHGCSKIWVCPSSTSSTDLEWHNAPALGERATQGSSAYIGNDGYTDTTHAGLCLMYGDPDVSVIDELPVGRKPDKTIHKFETARPQVIAFMHAEIAKRASDLCGISIDRRIRKKILISKTWWRVMKCCCNISYARLSYIRCPWPHEAGG